MAEELSQIDPTTPPGAAMTDEQSAQPPPPDYENAANIAASLPPEEAKKVARQVVFTAKLDWDGSKEFRERRASWLKMFVGLMGEKPAGHENLAQIHLPLIARSTLLFHAKLYSQLFPSTGDIYGALPTEPNDEMRTKRLSRHINFQVRRKIPEYIPAHDRGLMQTLLYGSAFSVWYYDPLGKRPCFEFCRTDDIILPYKFQSDRPDLADVPRITRRLYKYRPELEELEADGYYANVTNLYQDVGEDGRARVGNDWGKAAGGGTADNGHSGKPVTALVTSFQGVKPQEDDPDAPRELLEQDFLLKLPGQPRRRPVTAVVDLQTETLLRLSLRERDDPDDRARYNRENDLREAQIQSQEAMYAQDEQAWRASVEYLSQPREDVDEFGNVVLIPPLSGEDLPPPPPRPTPPPEPAPVRKIAWNRYTHYICVPNPEGIYGLGLGFLLEGDNVAADAWASAMISLATLNIKPTFMYSRNAALQRGDIQLRLGEGVESPLPPELLSKAFHQFQFPAPPPQGFKFLELFQQNAESLGAPEIFSGEVSDRETATTTEIRASMAMQNLSTMAERYNRARSNEVKTLAYINSQTLDDLEYFYVQEEGTVEPNTVGRLDYVEDFDVTFTADPNLASQPQKERAAMRAIQSMSQIPPEALMLPPEAMSALWRTLTADLMRSIGSDKAAAIIEKAPIAPPPMLPPGAPQGETPNGPPSEMAEPGPGAEEAVSGEPAGPEPGGLPS